jgi:hypothetical protein
VASGSKIVTVDLIDVITVITGPIIAMMTGIDMIIAATIAAIVGAEYGPDTNQ